MSTAAPDAPAVLTRGLVREYPGGGGLHGVDVRVPRGCVYGLVGPNGAGKTTLLSIVTGLRRNDSGTVTVGIVPERVSVGPDVPAMEPWLTAREVVELALRLSRGTAEPAAVDRALAVAGLTSVAKRRVGGFSRGMTQRLSLAAALVGEPDLLILDEPTSALDPAGRAEILDVVASYGGARTVIFSSHILGDVQRVAEVVGVLDAGRMLYEGPTQTLLDTYLKPRWRVRVRDGAPALADALAAQPWTVTATAEGAGVVDLTATTIEAGESGLPQVLAALGSRLISCEPVDADLEAAFLALTGEARP